MNPCIFLDDAVLGLVKRPGASLDPVLAGPKPIADMIQPTKWPNLNVIPSADNRASQIHSPLKVRIMVYYAL